MSAKTKILALEEKRSRLERRANVIRARLLRTVDALDDRRHQIQEIGHHAKRLVIPIGAAIIGVALLTAGAAFGVSALIHRRIERRLGYRVSRALAPLRKEKREPFWREALRKMGLTALGILASELTRRGARALLVGHAPRALLGPAPLPAPIAKPSLHGEPLPSR